jgi:hypothetical protein
MTLSKPTFLFLFIFALCFFSMSHLLNLMMIYFTLVLSIIETFISKWPTTSPQLTKPTLYWVSRSATKSVKHIIVYIISKIIISLNVSMRLTCRPPSYGLKYCTLIIYAITVKLKVKICTIIARL